MHCRTSARGHHVSEYFCWKQTTDTVCSSAKCFSKRHLCCSPERAKSLRSQESSQSTITPTLSVKEFCFIGSRSKFKGKVCFSAPTRAPTCPRPTPPSNSQCPHGSMGPHRWPIQHSGAALIRRVRVRFPGCKRPPVPSECSTADWML